jgi:hypothetical protein
MDLNIADYTREQLLDLFKLSDVTLTEDILESSYNKYVREIRYSSSVFTEKDKNDVINFCKEARDILMTSLKPEKQLIHKNISTHRYQYINIDTRFRNNYYLTTSSNFLVDLPINLKNVLEIGVEAFEPPNSYYMISSSLYNNCFSIQSKDTDLATITIIIPDGNYIVSSLIDYINDTLTAQVNSLNKIILSVDDGTGQFIFAIKSPNALFNFNVIFQVNSLGMLDSSPIQLKLGWLMGFRNGTYANNSAYVAEAISDLSGPKYIFLAIDDFNSGGFSSTQVIYTQSISSQNIIARISTTNSSINNSNLISLPRLYTHNGATIRKFQVSLIDEYGRIVQTNNMDFSFILKLKLSYIEN